MELTQLRYFLHVADTQHMTRSAEQLHVAQPALTRSVRRLEQELGVPLFAAHGRGIVLSEYGRYLQQKLQPLLERLDEIPNDLQKLAHLEENTVRVNVSAASTLVTDAVIAYKKSHPHVTFQLMQNAESELYDIGIHSHLQYTVPAGKQQYEFVLSEKIFLAVPIGHAAAARHTLALSDAADEGFISLMGSRPFRHICDRLCRQAGFVPNIIFESDNQTTVKNMIAAEMGVGFWPEYTWGHLDNDRVHLLALSDPLSRRDILFDCRPDKVHHPVVGDFFVFLKRYCTQQKQRVQTK